MATYIDIRRLFTDDELKNRLIRAVYRATRSSSGNSGSALNEAARNRIKKGHSSSKKRTHRTAKLGNLR